MFFVRPNFGALPILGALALCALCLSGCGRRGPLEPPPGAAASNAPLTGTPDAVQGPKNSPDPSAPNPAVAAEAQAEGKTEPAKALPPRATVPPKPFFLDPLL
ncbi:LPS translocon maturation chaperone LptM [Methylocapsa acidiphila]|uniref:LPS translocon maturation chaperone LptM n=1 Tax=Methylocapsa acidiphila TaxID=133552 RepID=UPI000420F74C|nr:lipoprotein [Methylocapsa acidiphila]